MNFKSNLLLRLAIALAFLYPAIDGFIEPQAWISYFPQFLLTATAAMVSSTMLLHIWSVVEIIIALWILSGKHIFIPSVLATLALALVVLFNIPLMQILFRDVALALVTLKLAIDNYPTKARP